MYRIYKFLSSLVEYERIITNSGNLRLIRRGRGDFYLGNYTGTNSMIIHALNDKVNFYSKGSLTYSFPLDDFQNDELFVLTNGRIPEHELKILNEFLDGSN